MMIVKKSDKFIEGVIEPHIPFYARSPNKIIKYYNEDFDDGCGHTAVLRKVIYLDTKKNKTHVATAQVSWIA